MVKKVVGVIFLFIWLCIQIVPGWLFTGVNQFPGRTASGCSDAFISAKNTEEGNFTQFYRLINEGARENCEDESEESDNLEDSDVVSEYLLTSFKYSINPFINSISYNNNFQKVKLINSFFQIPSPPPKYLL